MNRAKVSVSSTRDRLLGTVFVLAAALAWSVAGVFTRMLTIDLWTTISWRAMFGAFLLFGTGLLISDALSRDKWLQMLRPAGIAIVVCQILGQVTFVAALYHTSVANVCVIGATLPAFAAVLGRVYLKEPITLRTSLAAVLCFVGVLIVFSSSTETGNLLGDALAVVMILCFTVVIIIPRAHGEVPIMPTAVTSAVATFILFMPVASVTTIQPLDWLVLAAFGATSFCIGLALYLAGAKKLSPSETALIGTTEVVMAPLWVWLLYAETPSISTFVGGAIILLTLVGLAVSGFYRRPAVPLKL